MATAVVWAALFLFLGYLFSGAAKAFLKGFQAAEAILVVALILFAIIYHLAIRPGVPQCDKFIAPVRIPYSKN